MGTLVCFHAHPDDESHQHRWHDGPGQRRGSPGGAGGRHQRRLRRGARRPRRGRDARRPAPRRDRALGRRARRASRRVARLQGQRHDRLGAERRPGVVPPGAASTKPPSASPTSCARSTPTSLTVYDWHGNYGHPDHIKVHTVGHRAAELAGTPQVFEATMNREHIVRLIAAAREAGLRRSATRTIRSRTAPPTTATRSAWPRPSSPSPSTSPPIVARKRTSLRCHRSQVTDTSFFLEMPDEAFAARVRHRVVHPEGGRAGSADRAGCSNDPAVPRAPRSSGRRLGHRS